MPGPTPISVGYRLTFKYTVSGLTHDQRCYLDCVSSSDPSGYDAVGWNGLGNTGVSGIADYVFDKVKVFYNPAWSSFVGWVLERWTAPQWIYVSAGSTGVVPTGAGSIALAGGWDVVGKDTLNKTCHVYWYEGNFRLVDKTQSYASLNTAEKAVIDLYFGVGSLTDAKAPANWRKTRGDAFPKRWLSSVWDTNEKLRRIRRIK